ncbi:beta strand repeat-containing protein [Roseicella frigidaeris]|nr:FG-GAP-like repeat-containing protein [Roseicella frigidaeris]
MRKIGTSANDTLTGDLGSDSIEGGGGTDTLTYAGLAPGYDLAVTFSAPGSAAVVKSSQGTPVGTDRVAGIAAITGGAGRDLFDFTAAYGRASTTAAVTDIAGGAGNDTIKAAGRSWVEADYTGAAGSVIASLQMRTDADGHQIGQAVDGDGGIDTLIDLHRIRGSTHADRITGGAGNDTVTGSLGNDTLAGGAGSNLLDYSRMVAPDGTTLRITLNSDGSGTAEKSGGGTDGFTAFQTINAGGGADRIEAAKAAASMQVLRGMAGADTIDGADSLLNLVDYALDIAGVSIDLGAGTARDGWGDVDALQKVLRIRGSDFADTIKGSGKSETFDASLGSDSYAGGGGSDTLSYSGLLGRSVTIVLTAAGTGTAVKSSGGGTDSFSGIGVVQGSSGGDMIRAAAGATGVTLLRGLGGTDTIDGASNALNVVDYSQSAAGVAVNLANGIAADGEGASDRLSHVVAVQGSRLADTIVGGSAATVFYGTTGNDRYTGGSAADTLSYAWTDGIRITTRFDAAGTGTVSKAGGAFGTDSVTGIDTLVGGRAADDLGGHVAALGTTLFLDGGSGNDTLRGYGLDENVADYAARTGPLTAVLGAGGTASLAGGEVDRLVGIVAIRGTAQADRITGSAADERVIGSGGNDTIAGGGGHDTLDYGQAGLAAGIAATWTGADSGSVAKLGTDKADSFGGIDHIVGTGFADSIAGHAAITHAVYVFGGAGSDSIAGGGSALLVADYQGGAAIQADLGAGTVVEAYATPSTDRLTGIVALRGSAQADAIAGTAAAETLWGGAGDDTLAGGGGADSLDGGAGNDRILPGAGNATIAGGAGHDTLVLDIRAAEASLARTADGGWTVTGPQGTVLLHDVEAVQFSDGLAQLRSVAQDFDGDGKSEILFEANDLPGSAGYYALSQWQVNGAAFAAGATFTFVDPAWSVARTGDFNGDGKADLLWHQADGTAAIWLMSGTAYVDGATVYAPAAGTAYDIAGVDDFNGDGRSDILFSRQVSWGGHDYVTLSLWEMDGLGGIGGGVVGTVDASWSVAGSGDFDGDGRADILWQNANSAVSVWRMDGTQYLGGDTIATPGAGWSVVGTGDFDGDGRSDILLQSSAGKVQAWRMDGTTILSKTVLDSQSAGWTVAAIGDYDGNGRAEVLWRQDPVAGQGHSELRLWTTNGQVVTSDDLISYVDNAWMVV